MRMGLPCVVDNESSLDLLTTGRLHSHEHWQLSLIRHVVFVCFVPGWFLPDQIHSFRPHREPPTRGWHLNLEKISQKSHKIYALSIKAQWLDEKTLRLLITVSVQLSAVGESCEPRSMWKLTWNDCSSQLNGVLIRK